MSRNHRRTAFTLIEVLIVVIIMAVLAATIIPQFSTSTTDAKQSSLDFDLRVIRSRIEMYKFDHNDQLPTFASFSTQMTETTDIDGTQTGSRDYGPYIDEIPANPFNSGKSIVAVATAGTEPSAVVAGGAGWQYDETTGGFYPNNDEAY